eukprot:6387016-Amphidinium_carterae.1
MKIWGISLQWPSSSYERPQTTLLKVSESYNATVRLEMASMVETQHQNRVLDFPGLQRHVLSLQHWTALSEATS